MRYSNNKLTVKRVTTLIFSISILLSLNACSSNKAKEMSNLQGDFQHYKHSSYVEKNIVARNLTETSMKGRSNTPLHSIKGNTKQVNQTTQRKLKIAQNKLASRTKHGTARLSNVIIRNGLYTPSATLLKTTSRQKPIENWLKNHSSLAAVLTLALKNNLDIASSHQSAKANLAKYDQVSFLDDILTQYATFTSDLQLTGSTQKHKKAANAGFPLPSLLALKASIIDQTVESSRLQLKQTVQDVITKARIAYAELQYLQNDVSITNKNIKLLNVLKQQVEDSYATYGTDSKLDLASILEVEIEIDKAKNTLQIATQKQRAQQARLNSLLNISSDFKLGKLDPLKLFDTKRLHKTKQLLIKAKQYRIEIVRLQSEQKKMQRIIQLSEKRFYPDFSAGHSKFKSRGSKQTFTQKPTFKNNSYFAKNDAYLTETKEKLKALKLKINALKIKTEDDIQQVLSRYLTQKSSYALYHSKIIPKAKATLNIAKNLYETGEASYLDVIDAEKMILNYQLLSLQAVKDMNISLAQVSRLVGTEVF